MSPRWTRIVGPGHGPAEGPGVDDEAGGDGDVPVDDRHVDVVHGAGQDRRRGRVAQDVRRRVRIGDGLSGRTGGRRCGRDGRHGVAGDGHLALHAGVGVPWNGADEAEAAGRDRDRAGGRGTGVGGDLRAVGERQVVLDRAGVVERDRVAAGGRHGDGAGLEAQVECIDGDRPGPRGNGRRLLHHVHRGADETRPALRPRRRRCWAGRAGRAELGATVHRSGGRAQPVSANEADQPRVERDDVRMSDSPCPAAAEPSETHTNIVLSFARTGETGRAKWPVLGVVRPDAPGARGGETADYGMAGRLAEWPPCRWSPAARRPGSGRATRAWRWSGRSSGSPAGSWLRGGTGRHGATLAAFRPRGAGRCGPGCRPADRGMAGPRADHVAEHHRRDLEAPHQAVRQPRRVRLVAS